MASIVVGYQVVGVQGVPRSTVVSLHSSVLSFEVFLILTLVYPQGIVRSSVCVVGLGD